MTFTRLLWIALLLVALAFATALVVGNPEPLTVDLYVIQFTYPAGIVLLAALGSGVGVSILFGAALLLYYRRRMKKAQKETETAQEEVQNLRRMIVRDQED